jgi:hypothetical protein
VKGRKRKKKETISLGKKRTRERARGVKKD